jgi:hypothetical protein
LRQLVEQRQRVVVIDEAHGLAGAQGIERAENRGMAKALGNAARVKGVDGIGGEMNMHGVLPVGWDKPTMHLPARHEIDANQLKNKNLKPY